MKLLFPLGLLTFAAYLVSQPLPQEIPGPQENGSYLLTSGWRLRPAGTQIPLEQFPMSTALSPDGRFLLVLSAGEHPSIQVFDSRTLTQLGRVDVPDAWLGMTLTPNGRSVYVAGGSKASVFEFNLSNEGQIKATRTFAIVAEDQRKAQDFTGDVAISPDGRLLYAAMLYRDEVAVINPLSGIVIEKFRTGRRPYRILIPPDGKSLFISSWIDSAIFQHRAETGERMGVIRTGPHPTDMIWRSKQALAGGEDESEWAARLFVTASNSNSVYVYGIRDDGTTGSAETINVAFTANQPAGMTPSALAMSHDKRQLYIVCSDANAVATLDISARSRALGFIPTGAYPTAARALPDGRLFILNGHGVDAGSASVIPVLSDQDFAKYTQTVLANSPYRDDVLTRARAQNSIVAGTPGGKSPVEHVIYIVKEGRSYDQVLGDLGIGNGDPSLAEFKEDSTPNHRKLAREFVLLDNFYANGDASADGNNWAAAAIASDYVQKLSPNRQRAFYDYEGLELAALPPAAYLWTNALARGITLKNYGWWVTNKPAVAAPGEAQVELARDPALRGATNLHFRGFDLDYRDTDRAKVFLTDLAEFERQGKLPQLTLIRLGNDRTSGKSPGKISPAAAMADNDWALGMIVEGVSRSKFWPSTAIFVVESYTENGRDHVNSHRAPAFVISPYTRSRGVDSTMYNTTSALRTIELIVGLRPMTHFDAAAMPMAYAFQSSAVPGAYEAVRPRQPLEDRNPQ